VGNGQCVAFVQAHGFHDYRGDAYQWKKYATSEIGWLGDAVLLDEGPFMHLALIAGINDGYQLVEQNYIGEYIISTRSIPFDYGRIVGFIPKPASLNAPGEE
jgi:surface antigen